MVIKDPTVESAVRCNFKLKFGIPVEDHIACGEYRTVNFTNSNARLWIFLHMNNIERYVISNEKFHVRGQINGLKIFIGIFQF